MCAYRVGHKEAMLADRQTFDKPAIYEIRVKGTVDAAWASYWFADFVIAHLPGGESLLRGQVADQSALLGLLAQMRDLGLPTLSVRRIGHRETTEEETQDGKDNE
jgi:hypothetical protein